jgi:hypothetical protein
MNIGKVVVRPATRTTIAAPDFSPKMNIAISDIQDIDVVAKQNGDTLIYDATTGQYKSGPIDTASLIINNINGGSF